MKLEFSLTEANDESAELGLYLKTLIQNGISFRLKRDAFAVEVSIVI